jgi:hypothetical protein
MKLSPDTGSEDSGNIWVWFPESGDLCMVGGGVYRSLACDLRFNCLDLAPFLSN